jgi:hypothetical protein
MTILSFENKMRGVGFENVTDEFPHSTAVGTHFSFWPQAPA